MKTKETRIQDSGFRKRVRARTMVNCSTTRFLDFSTFRSTKLLEQTGNVYENKGNQDSDFGIRHPEFKARNQWQVSPANPNDGKLAEATKSVVA